jgi:phosphatidylglycerophosphatase A
MMKTDFLRSFKDAVMAIECRKIVTVGGVGDRKPAPGTLGSLIAVPFGLLVLVALGAKALAIMAVLLFLVGWWAVHKAKGQFAAVDAPQIVVDEVVGMWLSLLVINPTNPIEVVMAFAFFRYFDIDKPWPISWVQRRAVNAFGVMFDDVLAAGYATVFLLAFVPLVRAYLWS